MPGRTENLFLSSLSPTSQDLLLSRSTAVPLPRRSQLFLAGAPLTHIYLLTSGVASIITSMRNGAVAEVGMIGREGVIGGLQALGPALGPIQGLIQVEGTGLRITMGDFQDALRSAKDIRDRLLEYVQAEAMALGQIAACHRLHSAEERLARWLLTARDRTRSDTLNLTQEFMAQMLGARRATVTVVAGCLQRSGLIQYQRGRVKIVDRLSLEAAACDCYQVVKRLHDTLYIAPLGARQNASR